MDSTFAGMPATPFKYGLIRFAVMSVLPGRCPAPGTSGPAVRVAWFRQPGDARGQVRPAVDEQGGDDRQQVPAA